MQKLEQGYSELTEGEQDLMRTCRQEENYNNQGESRLLPRLPFLLLQWSGMNECVAEHEYENMMPCKSRKHAYRKTYENLGKHLDFLGMIGGEDHCSEASRELVECTPR